MCLGMAPKQTHGLVHVLRVRVSHEGEGEGADENESGREGGG